MKASKLYVPFVAIGSLAACAGARPAGSPPDTVLSVLDASGASVPGEYELLGKANDTCSSSSDSCSVNLPEGDYTFTFTKVRFGRLVTSGGGNAGGERGTGCVRARVHLVPGVEIKCKQTADFDCEASAVETMDCGPASVAHRPVPAAATPAH